MNYACVRMPYSCKFTISRQNCCLRPLLHIFFVLFLFTGLAPLSWAEIVTYSHTVRQPFTGSQSPDDARTAAIAKAKREVLEKAGTYLDSITVVKNHQLEHDQITALSSAVLQTEIVSQKNFMEGEAFGIEIVAKVCVDTSTLEERIQNFLKDRSALAKAEKLERREKELLARVKELEERSIQLELAAKKKKTKEMSNGKLSKEFTKTAKMLSAIDANRKALALWDRVQFINPEKAIIYLNEAIRKDDHFAEAFNNRGIAYANLGKWQQAIRDYQSAIQLEPGLSDAFNNRGTAYAYLGETQKAINDFNRAIEINPQFAHAFYNRATAKSNKGLIPQAIDDFNRAIELDSGHAASYYNRGNAYAAQQDYLKAIHDYDRAIEIDANNPAFYFNRAIAFSNREEFHLACRDFDKVIQLNPQDVFALKNRGIALFKAEQYRKAIEDFDKVLSLQNHDVKAYKYRGLSYFMLGEQKKFCADLKTACALGDCESLDLVRNDGLCK